MTCSLFYVFEIACPRWASLQLTLAENDLQLSTPHPLASTSPLLARWVSTSCLALCSFSVFVLLGRVSLCSPRCPGPGWPRTHRFTSFCPCHQSRLCTPFFLWTHSILSSSAFAQLVNFPAAAGTAPPPHLLFCPIAIRNRLSQVSRSGWFGLNILKIPAQHQVSHLLCQHIEGSGPTSSVPVVAGLTLVYSPTVQLKLTLNSQSLRQTEVKYLSSQHP